MYQLSSASSSRNRSVQSAGIGNLHRELGRRVSERLVLRWIWLHLESFLVYSHFNDNREQFHEAVTCSVDTHRHDYRIEPYSFYRNSQQSLILIHSKSQSHPSDPTNLQLSSLVVRATQIYGFRFAFVRFPAMPHTT